MSKTRVDDMLIEMIEPKIREINEKFSNGEKLTQDDINTLLLKSQYNHINHLDDKLNETVETVKNLEHKFDKLENQYKSDFGSLKNEYKSDFDKLENQYKNDFGSLKNEYKSDFDKLENQYKSDFGSLKNEYKSDFEKLRQEIETTIQKALNKNMMLLITIIGVFLTLSKLIDKF